ncbi:MAG: hypothetical protein HY744_15820 [Deltaproteobacteria bacterium]|nr:hypothetical protein [Deltaproteobacteria bacterium]
MASEKGSGVGRQGLWHRALCMLVILAGLVGACSGDDSAPAATPGPAQGGGGTGSGGGGGGGGGGEGGATGTLVLPAAGGTVEDAATGVVIVVPEGALAADLPITIGLAADASAAAPIPDFELDGTGPMV